MTFAPRFTITNRITADLTTIERARGFLEAATISEEWVRRMSQRALLLEAHHTTHIEGTQLSVEQAEQVWTGHEVKGANPDDVRELLNYRGAFGLVSEYLSSGAPISEGLIREIHKRLVECVCGGRAMPGEWRTIQNYVANNRTGEVIYTPPPPGEVPALMRELVEWLRSEERIHRKQCTWGDCAHVTTLFSSLIELGILPADGAYAPDATAQLVWLSDGMPWFSERILPLFDKSITVVLDVYHLLERAAVFAKAAYSKVTDAQRWYQAFSALVTNLDPSQPRSKTPKTRKGPRA